MLLEFIKKKHKLGQILSWKNNKLNEMVGE